MMTADLKRRAEMQAAANRLANFRNKRRRLCVNIGKLRKEIQRGRKPVARKDRPQ